MEVSFFAGVMDDATDSKRSQGSLPWEVSGRCAVDLRVLVWISVTPSALLVHRRRFHARFPAPVGWPVGLC